MLVGDAAWRDLSAAGRFDGRRDDDFVGAVVHGKIVVEPVAEPLIREAVTRVARGRPSAVLGRKAHAASPGAGRAARNEPMLEVDLEDADAALADLHLRWARPFGEHALQRAADDTRPICGLVKAEDLHMRDLVVLGRKRGRNDQPNFLPRERAREAYERGVRDESASIVGKSANFFNRLNELVRLTNATFERRWFVGEACRPAPERIGALPRSCAAAIQFPLLLLAQ